MYQKLNEKKGKEKWYHRLRGKRGGGRGWYLSHISSPTIKNEGSTEDVKIKGDLASPQREGEGARKGMSSSSKKKVG